jgi:hypothetical protein
MSDFAAKKSVIEHLSKRGSGTGMTYQNAGQSYTNNLVTHKTNSIFESRDIDDLEVANQSKHLMLQDSLVQVPPTLSPDDF